MQTEIITLSDIKNEEIKKRILICNEGIKEFIELLNSQLQEDEKLGDVNLYIKKERILYGMEYSYYVYWTYSLDPKKIINENCLFDDDQGECLSFCYHEVENVSIGKSGMFRFLSLFIFSMKNKMDEIDETDQTDETDETKKNKDNFDFNSILNVENAVTCILKIQEISKRRRLKEALLNEKENKK